MLVAAPARKFIVVIVEYWRPRVAQLDAQHQSHHRRHEHPGHAHDEQSLLLFLWESPGERGESAARGAEPAPSRAGETPGRKGLRQTAVRNDRVVGAMSGWGLSGFKNLYSKSVDLIKQVQDSVEVKVKGQGAPAPTVAPHDSHPGYYLVENYERKWEQVVANSAALAAKVAAEDAAVKRFTDECESSAGNWSALQAELSALDGTLKTAAAVRESMEKMCSELEVLDKALDGHCAAKEERDMYKWKTSIEQNTEQFEASRAADLATMEKNLKADKLRQEKLKKAEEDRILREIEAKERREAALAAEAERREKAEAALVERKKQEAERAAAEAERKAQVAAERAAAEAARREKMVSGVRAKACGVKESDWNVGTGVGAGAEGAARGRTAAEGSRGGGRACQEGRGRGCPQGRKDEEGGRGSRGQKCARGGGGV